MHPVDLAIFILYIFGVLGVGLYFMYRNKNNEDYYLGSRDISYPHVGLSVVATDVGGGFSIGLGGLGFVMGIAGSWMLFTGLIGAWMAAVFLIPIVKPLADKYGFFTMPDVFAHFLTPKAALIAAIISAVGYLGFTSSQILAGAVLASATFTGLTLQNALWIMGAIIVVYTVTGGIKAVIYTDTFQWVLLLTGLIFIGVPLAYTSVGGYESIAATVTPEMLSLDNISWQQAVNWSLTIIPIWFVGMTLYQRIYATKSVGEAKKAWYMAGLFEWPIMAFLGFSLGLFARVAAEQGMFGAMGFDNAEEMHPEQGLPMLLRTILPIGLMGLMMSAYFSAIMSTADSCLVAASGNITGDLLGKWFGMDMNDPRMIRLSQVVTLVAGVLALMLAAVMETVLDIMLYSYAVMVAGLFIPLAGALWWKGTSRTGALFSMITGGALTLLLIAIPEFLRIRGTESGFELPLGLDPIVYGMLAALIALVLFSRVFPDEHQT